MSTHEAGAYDGAAQHDLEITDTLITNGILEELPYSSFKLTVEPPEFTDAYGPDAQFIPESVAIYWPGGNPFSKQEYEMVPNLSFKDNAERMEYVMLIRKAILSSQISPETLATVSQEVKDHWQASDLVGLQYGVTLDPPIWRAIDLCSSKQIPLAICQTSKIQDGKVGTDRAMHLWSPAFLSPKPVLAFMRKVVKNVMEEEAFRA